MESALARAHAAHPSDWVEASEFQKRMTEVSELGVDVEAACVEDLYLAMACVRGTASSFAGVSSLWVASGR